jgi:hypothetical protein
MPCTDFLQGLLGLTQKAPPKSTPKPTKELADAVLPAELVEEIISFVPPVVQEARYTTAIVGPKGIDVSLFGNYTVTFEGDVFVGGKAKVHLSVTDERRDRLTKFPTFDYLWVTEVTGISEEGIDLARGNDECSYTIKQEVVLGRLQTSRANACAPRGSFSDRPEMSKTLRRSESF